MTDNTEVSRPGHQVRLGREAKAKLAELAAAEQRQQSKELAVIIDRYYQTWRDRMIEETTNEPNKEI